MSKVSICIPCYNNRDEVDRLLRSIYRQDYIDFEVNISDDSKDNDTADLVREYQKEYGDLLRYIHNPEPLGHIFNWNAAISMATGEYIKVMFSDDWFTDEKSLGKYVKLLDTHPEADLAFSGSMQVLLDGQNSTEIKHMSDSAMKDMVGTNAYARCAKPEFIAGLKKDYRHLFLGNQIGAPSASIYRNHAKNGGQTALFDEKSNWASDMFLYFDLLQENPNFAYSEEPLVSIGMHENQYTETFSERDMRVYNDYRYLYTKYDLQDSRECREYFTEYFIVKYHQGIQEARTLKIESGIYWNKWILECKATCGCFIKSRIGKK